MTSKRLARARFGTLCAVGEMTCDRPDKPCATCGRPVEKERHCYAIPTCYARLPPPAPLPVRQIHATSPPESAAESREANERVRAMLTAGGLHPDTTIETHRMRDQMARNIEWRIREHEQALEILRDVLRALRPGDEGG